MKYLVAFYSVVIWALVGIVIVMVISDLPFFR